MTANQLGKQAPTSASSEPNSVEDSMRRIESLVGECEMLCDAAARDLARELARRLLDVHRVAITRVLELANRAGDPGRRLVEALANDELVASVLSLHGLHPVAVCTRVENAVESLRPFFRSLGDEVELLDVTSDSIRVRLRARDDAATSNRLKVILEEAILAAAPEIERIDIAVEHVPHSAAHPAASSSKPAAREVASAFAESSRKLLPIITVSK